MFQLEHTKVRNYLMFCGPSTMVLVKGMNGFMGSRYSRYRQYFRFSDSTYSCTVDDNIEYRLCCLIKITKRQRSWAGQTKLTHKFDLLRRYSVNASIVGYGPFLHHGLLRVRATSQFFSSALVNLSAMLIVFSYIINFSNVSINVNCIRKNMVIVMS